MCEPCRADALESLAMPVRDSTRITGDKKNGMEVEDGQGGKRKGMEEGEGL